MKRRILRSAVALLVGLAMSQMVSGPVSASLLPGTQIAVTGQMWDRTGQLSYCGGGYSMIGDLADPTKGAAITTSGLWWTFCSFAVAWPLPRNWLVVSAAMLRDGSACATTPMVRNDSSTAGFGVYVGPCFNPPGWQEWETLGGHGILNDGAGVYEDGWTLSSWQLY